MPRGPNGQRRPADAIGCAVMVAGIATGEQRDTTYAQPNKRRSGIEGAKARNDNLSAVKRSEVATKAAEARWRKGEVMNTGKTMLDRIYTGDVSVMNLKLFPGTDRDSSSSKVMEQVERVISEIENGVLEIIELDD